MSAPALVVVLEVESPARAFFVCASFEEQQRIALELEHRDTSTLAVEIAEALEELAGHLADRHEGRR